MFEPNDSTQSQTRVGCSKCGDPVWQNGLCKECGEVQWRAFLAWQMAWGNALVVSMIGTSMVPWGNGEHALGLITYAALSPAAIDELYTRHLDVADYWESRT